MAERTFGAAPANDSRKAFVAAGFPTRPKATAAADATSASLSCKRVVSNSTAFESRRTPSELIMPTRSWSWTVSVAFRNASFEASPGIASSAIRAHDDNSGSGNNFANSGTAALEPSIANRLQVIAFSAFGPSDLRTASSSFSLSDGNFLVPPRPKPTRRPEANQRSKKNRDRGFVNS